MGQARLTIKGHGMAALTLAILLLPGARLRALQEPVPDSVQEPTETPSPTPQQPAAESNRATVQGTVRNSVSGDPLPRVLIQIEGDAETGTLTDSDGHFELPNVPIGAQTIRVQKPGYRDRSYPAEEPGPQSEGPAHSVQVAVQMPALNFSLAPNCAIHGHIEISSGDPASGFTVILMRRIVRFGREVWSLQGNARTNGDGNYRFGGLSDGVYALMTQPALESEPATSVVTAASAANVVRGGYASVFYPDVRELSGASLIRISGGSQAEANFSLALEPFYAVSAVSAAGGANSGKPTDENGFTASLFDPSGQILPYPVQYDSATHGLQASLPNGNYTLVMRGASGPRAAEFAGLVSGLSQAGVSGAGFNVDRLGGGGSFAGAIEFTVSGHPVTGLRVPMGASQQALVHLRLVHTAENSTAATAFASGQNAQPVSLNLDQANGAPLNSSENVWTMNNHADSISFGADPGTYWVSAVVQARGICMGTFSAGGVNLAREPLTLSMAASPPPMELTLRDDCGSLSLTLPGALATLLPGEEPFYTVYIVPDFETAQDIPPMTVHPSSGATVNVDGLAPGSYHVYSFDSPIHLAYRDPAAVAALSSGGQQVTVSAGTTANVMLEGLER